MNQIIGSTIAGVIIGACILIGAAMLRQPPEAKPISDAINRLAAYVGISAKGLLIVLAIVITVSSATGVYVWRKRLHDWECVKVYHLRPDCIIN